ncbi:MAG: 4Fe-4S binding protein [Halanaerobiales bacterium]
MRKITVISGKGGTGKTTVVSNLAALADNLVLADCDVDAPNMHLLMQPDIQEDKVFISAKLAVKDKNKCINCGKCREACRFNAVDEEFEINPIKCDGCGVCVYICPEGALRLEEQETGHIFISTTRFAPMVHARLKAGAENSGKLVSRVRDFADKIAEEKGKDLVLVDGSPGIGCPVIASLKGIDYSLVVTEPTLSGLSDLKRVLEVTKLFDINAFVIINKYDINKDISQKIEQYCVKNNVEVIGRISFSPLINQAMREGKLLVNMFPDSIPASEINAIWSEISGQID